MTGEAGAAGDGPAAGDERRRSTARRLPLDGRDVTWLGVGLGAGLLATAVYLATNPYPAYGAGLYVRMAREIVAHGYGLPVRVSGYTADGVPFAYPPLQLYVLAVALDLGADPVALARLLPSVGAIAALGPTYLLARDYTASRPAGAFASVAVALNPQLVQWHLSAGGVVRAFAFCYAMFAIYAGYRVFETGSVRAVAAGVVGVAATLLSHPTYALFVVASYLLLWATRDRTVGGVVRGAVVGLGGVAIATPWLVRTVATHGPGVFGAAAGTHGGVGGGVATLVEGAPFTLLPLAGAAYLLVVARDRFLPAWTVAVALLFAQPRFSFTVGSVVLAAVAADVGRRRDTPDGRAAGGVDRNAALAVVCLVAVSAGGGAYLAHEMTLAGDPSTPEFLDDEAVDAMAWAAAGTPPDAAFVVVGDAAEWFPALADRTILVGPWGVEWRGPAPYDAQMDAYVTVSRCRGVDCVESAVAAVDGDPEYVYLPKGRYTIRGEPVEGADSLDRSFERSAAWDLAYENEGVVVYRARE
jgi:hypothetical protein